MKDGPGRVLGLVMTDGRQHCMRATMTSALTAMRDDPAAPEHWVINDDSGDPVYRDWLLDAFPEENGYTVIGPPHGRSGFGGAIRSAWLHLRRVDLPPFEYVFHLEDDFTFNRPVPLEAMRWVLWRSPHLVQLALRRQPWNEHERKAGGIVELHPGSYVDMSNGGDQWLEHRRFFTTNPSMYRRALVLEHDWPEGPHSEGHFGIELLRQHPDWRFAFWGARESGEWVHHIGDERIGTGY